MPAFRIAYLLYCIIENKASQLMSPGSAGILPAMSGKDAPAIFSNLTIAADLEKISYRDIAVITRKVDTEGTEKLKSNAEQLKNWLMAYQQANIDISRYYTILPLRFGTMVDHKEEIEDFLASNYVHVKWALDRLCGKTEFAVQLFWDLNAVLQEISQDKEWLEKAGKHIDLANRVEIGRLLFELADTKKKEIINSVHRKLAKISLDSSEGRCTNESVIINRSYLIEKAAEKSFDEAMEELGRENKSYLSFKYVGPIPPYSFAPIEFRQGNFELIDKARKVLMLPERAQFGEIKASYRLLSLKYHPDKNPGNQQYSQLFQQIDEAYKIIETYCFSREGSFAFRRNTRYSFKKDDVENAFIINRKVERPMARSN